MSVACWAPLSMRFSRQEYWSGLPFPSPGNLPKPGIETRSPALQADSLLTELEHRNRGCMAECKGVVEKGWDDYLIPSPQNCYHLLLYYLQFTTLVSFSKKIEQPTEENFQTSIFAYLYTGFPPVTTLRVPPRLAKATILMPSSISLTSLRTLLQQLSLPCLINLPCAQHFFFLAALGLHCCA